MPSKRARCLADNVDIGDWHPSGVDCEYRVQGARCQKGCEKKTAAAAFALSVFEHIRKLKVRVRKSDNQSNNSAKEADAK